MISDYCNYFSIDQKHIGEFLGIPCNRVNVRVKRIGKSNVEIPNKVICYCIFFLLLHASVDF